MHFHILVFIGINCMTLMQVKKKKKINFPKMPANAKVLAAIL